MNKKSIILSLGAVSAVVLTVVGGWLLMYSKESQPADAPTEAQVHITNEGFTPAELAVTPGTRVIWINTTDSPRRIAAAPYPDRTQLPKLDSDIIAPGESYVFTFENKGIIEYADYTRPTSHASIQVK